MKNKNNTPKEPWRIVVFVIAIAFIVFMWISKDISAINEDMPKEEAIPLIITTIAVSLLKVAAIALVCVLIKWILDKLAGDDSLPDELNKRAQGRVVKVSKQWWLKVNTKPIRRSALDGATFPHIIKVAYEVDGKEYTKRKWIHQSVTPPELDSTVTVAYSEANPKKAKIL